MQNAVKKGILPLVAKMPFRVGMRWSIDHDVRSRGAFRALLDIERHLVALLQGFETGARDGGVVNENIGSVFAFNKTITFFLIKPLDGPLRHLLHHPFSIIDRNPKLTAPFRHGWLPDGNIRRPAARVVP